LQESKRKCITGRSGKKTEEQSGVRRVKVEAWMLRTIGKKVEEQEEIWIDI
jgi:hypothetical protein